MLSEWFKLVLEWLKQKNYWNALQPFVVLAFGYVASVVLAFEYIQSQYGFEPSLRLFAGSYYFIRISAAFGGFALLVALFRIHPKRGAGSLPGRLRAYVQQHQPLLAFRLIAFLAVATLTVIAFTHFGPGRVSTIRVKLLNEPTGFKPDALAYLVYELNRQQKSWFYELDFEPFNPRVLTSQERREAENQERRQLYYAELTARGKPLIAITEESLGKAYFCEHRMNVSVISTVDKDYYQPLSTYEYLCYCLVVQSMLIHLDTEGGGLPKGAFEPSAASHGGVFQFNPTREVLKATILAARLSPDEEALLFNRFGPDYMNVCRQLLTLDWMRAERVKKNLSVHFGIEE